MLEKKQRSTVMRRKFTPEEDKMLIDLHSQYGPEWELISALMHDRNERQCKDRYMNYLDPSINREPFTEEEDNLIAQKYLEMGPKWMLMTQYFNNRTEASLKNRFQLLDRRNLSGKPIVYKGKQKEKEEEVKPEPFPKIDKFDQEQIHDLFAKPDDILKFWKVIYDITPVMENSDQALKNKALSF